MSITGPGSVTAAERHRADQHDEPARIRWRRSSAPAQAAQTYSGLQSQSGIVVALNAQLAAINGYSNTTTTVEHDAQRRAIGIDADRQQRRTVQQRSPISPGLQSQRQWADDGPGRRANAARRAFSRCSIPRSAPITSSRARGEYSHRWRSTSDILNGTGAQAGLTQIISERQQADLGSGTGRLSRRRRVRP